MDNVIADLKRRSPFAAGRKAAQVAKAKKRKACLAAQAAGFNNRVRQPEEADRQPDKTEDAVCR